MKPYIESDYFGNSLIAEKKGNHLEVYLKLAHKFKRHIGTVNIQERVMHTKRKRSKHMLLATLSYGFNNHLVRNAKSFDHILLTDEEGSYKIPREIIIDEGSYFYFKTTGFEKQIFLKIERIKEFQHGGHKGI